MKQEQYTRELNINTFDSDNYTFEFSFSSEIPYLRGQYYEILSHEEGAVNLDRHLTKSIPLLFNHDWDKPIGIIEDIYINPDTKRGHAVARMSRVGLGKDISQDVKDKILTSISVGYTVDSIVETAQIDGIPTYIAKKWTVLECSICTVPADPSIGIERSLQKTDEKSESLINKLNQSEEPEMTEDNTENIEETESIEETETETVETVETVEEEVEKVEEKSVDIEAITSEIRKAEKKRIKELTALGEKFNKKELAEKAIEDGVEAVAFKSQILDSIGVPTIIKTKSKGNNNMENTLGLTETEIKNYSFEKALTAAITGDWTEAKYEKELSDAQAAKNGKAARGFIIPSDVLKRDITTTTNGAALVHEDYRPQNFVDILRNKSVIGQTGATFLTDLTGNVSIPTQTGTANVSHILENGDAPESFANFGTIGLNPKTIAGSTKYSRQMLLQGNPAIHALVYNDLVKSMALGIDQAILNGDGTNGAPIGILNTTGIGAVDMSAAIGGLTYAKTIEMESVVEDTNADTTSSVYVTNPLIKAQLKTTEKVAGYPTYLMSEDGTLNGYKTIVSKQVPANSMLFGDFSNVIVGMWGGLDINVDEFTFSRSGQTLINAFQSYDVALRQPQAFSATTNIGQ
jgi:HK97 family phage major capsid protein/HK97 family phage prohead protease